MSSSQEPQRPRRSFSNGNMPQVIILPLEGHVIGDVHWWHWA